ncbi:MAG: OadG family protein [Bacteroidetes bacterium]|nr:OadG family protein [Bacteroidota bacterium]
MEYLFIIHSIITQGVQIAIIGYSIVFLALVLLYYVFTFLAKGLLWQKKNKLKKENKALKLRDEDVTVSGEVSAAIAMAIFLSRDLHDNESDIITIKRVSKTYSPWNSKIYGMRYFQR